MYMCIYTYTYIHINVRILVLYFENANTLPIIPDITIVICLQIEITNVEIFIVMDLTVILQLMNFGKNPLN